MTEIGSEFNYIDFEKQKSSFNIFNVKDFSFTFSGRTAIELIIKNEPKIKCVLLPSYCCQSMIDPFIDNKIKVKFYDVNYDKGIIIDNLHLDNVDAIVWCNYFGFKNCMPDLTAFKNKGGIIIEDITHSLLSKNPFDLKSDYLIASIRKWAPVLCGGIACSLNKKFKIKFDKNPDDAFLKKKKEAMILKSNYLFDNNNDKKVFLNKFKESNQWIYDHYHNLKIDDESLKIIKSLNWNFIANKRIENASIIYKGLNESKLVKFMFDFSRIETPLFVPVIVEKKYRNLIISKLIENQIYCPTHWPKPKTGCKSNLYETEISLVCDQRYGKEEMNKIIEVLKNIELEKEKLL